MDEYKPSPKGGQESVHLLKILITHQNWYHDLSPKKKTALPILKSWLQDPEIQEYLRINRYEGVLWFNKEAFDELTRSLLIIAIIKTTTEPKISEKKISARIRKCYKIIHQIRKASQQSGYQVEKLLELVNESENDGAN